MSEIICNFCDKKFFNSSNLKKHQNTAKYCLQIQHKKIIEELNCEFCRKNFTRKDTLEEHLAVCREADKVKIRELENQLEKCNNIIKNYKDEKKYIKSLEKSNEELILRIKQLEEKVLSLSEKYQTKLEEENKSFIDKYQTTLEKLTTKAIENAGSKTINNNRNQIYNALQPLTDDYMKEQAKFLTYENIKNGTHGIAHFASKHTFKDRIFCSDVSRLNFIFKNEEGTIIKDPEGVEITKKFIDINKEELVRLLEEYFNYVIQQLDRDDLDAVEYKHWAEKREEVIATRSAVKKGNMQNNKEYYTEFKKSFLQALSELVAR